MYNETMKRIFLAIELPGKIKKSLKKKLKEINSGNWREIDGNNLHITLIFFGNLTDEKSEKLITNLDQIEFNEFKIKLTQIIRKKDMLWAKIEKNDNLQSLYQRILEKIKFLKLKTPNFFNPHITLAKTKKRIKFPKIKIVANFKVKNITLFESKLNREGAKYYLLKRFKLI